VDYVNFTYDNAIKNIDDIKSCIAKYAIGYQLDRIYKPDLAVLILAIAEMKYNNEVPDSVAISEAVCIIKKYSTAKSGPFVNGILASVYKELNNQ
ncbi:MAG: transcription antitermination protein NusB, partial [Clostridia bacterium]|nr:transcription antitermination protein NusB [Clostridia bacterium]